MEPKYSATVGYWPCNGNGLRQMFVGEFSSRREAWVAAKQMRDGFHPDSRGNILINRLAQS